MPILLKKLKVKGKHSYANDPGRIKLRHKSTLQDNWQLIRLKQHLHWMLAFIPLVYLSLPELHRKSPSLSANIILHMCVHQVKAEALYLHIKCDASPLYAAVMVQSSPITAPTRPTVAYAARPFSAAW